MQLSGPSRPTSGRIAASLSYTFVVSRISVSGAIGPGSVAAPTRYVASSRPVTRTPSRTIRATWPGRPTSVTS